jgi:uncharacterized cofD-like protein
MSVGAGRKAVAIGGGTGLPLVLRSLVELGLETTAVVAMADDGGSSGVLREQLGSLPPGDIRNCLVALAGRDDDLLARVFQYRFGGGDGLAGHALGNLILAALADLTGDFATAVDTAARYLHVRGRVLPSTVADVRLHGVDRAGTQVSGQSLLASNPEPMHCVHLEPADPPAYPPAVEAIAEADVIVIGPGSLFTSIIPNLLVAGIVDAVRASSATRVYVCNVANQRGETSGFDAADHVAALYEHGLEGALDVAIVNFDDRAKALVLEDHNVPEPVYALPATLDKITDMGIDVWPAELASAENVVRHDQAVLTEVLADMLAEVFD